MKEKRFSSFVFLQLNYLHKHIHKHHLFRVILDLMVTSFVKIGKRYVKVGRKEGKLHGTFVLTVTVHGPCF